MKKRLDVLLVERGLAETRSQAQALVLAGLVRGFDKAGAQVDDTVELEVERPARFDPGAARSSRTHSRRSASIPRVETASMLVRRPAVSLIACSRTAPLA